MPRRVNLPTADDLFRPTVVPDVPDLSEEPAAVELPTVAATGPRRASGTESAATRQPSGRVRHDEKMTVYVTADELLEIEHARLGLRRSGFTVDRGRLVREAVAIVLADLEENGTDSVLVQRLLRT